jgi:hypothetical protein
MDLYRFFHPHHNPRLRNKPVRQQELSELELAARELYRAIDRASVRIASANSSIPLSVVSASSEAVELAVELLHQLVEHQPEDTEEDMSELLQERKNAPGWEAWCILLKERIEMLKKSFPTNFSNSHSPEEGWENTNQQSDLDDSFPSVSTLLEKKIVSA